MSYKDSNTGGRTVDFSRNLALEELLGDVNSTLWECEQPILELGSQPKHPVVFVMGPMRSGTTLFMQWLAATGVVAYPSNLLSRFYKAPIIGAKIQLLLTDPRYSFRDELGEFTQPTAFSSQNGKTQGALSPNEFWYFWRRFFADQQRDVWSDQELRSSFDAELMCAELSGVMDVFQKPFAAKGILFNYNIPFLDSILDKAFFVRIKRDPVANVASVLNARKRQFGTDKTWYSFKIPEYPELENLDPTSQVSGQVYYMNKAISRGLDTVCPTRKLVVNYEDFCVNPGAIFDELVARLDIEAPDYSGPARFEPRNIDASYKKSTIMNSLSAFSRESNT